MKNLVKRVVRRVPDKYKDDKVSKKLLVNFLKIIMMFDPDFKQELESATSVYAVNYHKKAKKKIRSKIIGTYIKNGITPSEFIKFDLLKKKDCQIAEYVPDLELLKIFRAEENNILPPNKYGRYLLFKEYYNRELLHICFNGEKTEQEQYQEFCKKHDTYIAKVIRGTKGHGIYRIDTSTTSDLSTLFEIVGNECILEEVINQGIELARFHPESVNTIRFVTGMSPKGVFNNLFALLRVGRGESIVDNVGSGGLVAMIDLATGIVTTDALCGNKYYAVHPDTKTQFKGYKIPSWEELCILAKNMHSAHMEQRLFGFDFAWTADGWDVVEVNPAPSFDSYQALTGRGIRPLLKRLELIN